MANNNYNYDQANALLPDINTPDQLRESKVGRLFLSYMVLHMILILVLMILIRGRYQ